MVIVGVGLAIALQEFVARTHGGEYRGDQHTWDHAHESPPAMSWVLAVLALALVFWQWRQGRSQAVFDTALWREQWAQDQALWQEAARS